VILAIRSRRTISSIAVSSDLSGRRISLSLSSRIHPHAAASSTDRKTNPRHVLLSRALNARNRSRPDKTLPDDYPPPRRDIARAPSPGVPAVSSALGKYRAPRNVRNKLGAHTSPIYNSASRLRRALRSRDTRDIVSLSARPTKGGSARLLSAVRRICAGSSCRCGKSSRGYPPGECQRPRGNPGNPSTGDRRFPVGSRVARGSALSALPVVHVGSFIGGIGRFYGVVRLLDSRQEP